MKRLEERKIHVELTDAAKDQLVREGLRSDLRRAAAEADDPAPRARSARAARARGRVRRRRHGRRRRRRRRPDVREAAVGAAHNDVMDMPSNDPTPRFNPRGGDRRGPRRSAAGRRRRSGTGSRFCCCSAWRRCTTWRRPADRFPTASSRRCVKNGAGRRGRRSAIRSIRGTLKEPAADDPKQSKQFTTTRVEDPKLTEELEAQRREVHRRGRQPLAARAPRLDHAARLLRRHLGLLLPPHERRRRRRDVVRAQPREDLRRRRSEGALHGRRRRRRSGGRAEGDRRVPEEPEEVHEPRRPDSRRACCWSARRAPARRCWRARSPARRTCRSSA